MLAGFIFDLDDVITDTAEFHYLAWKRLADEKEIPFSRADKENPRLISSCMPPGSSVYLRVTVRS
jgi:beta-phosphoglucomutase